MKPSVSIIIPVYKVEKYLPRCIRSLEAQTYTDYEVILVDDGSPDGCGAICDSYAERDPRVKVIHQANQGQAAARNRAAQIAQGDYITFVDSDDFIEPDYIEYLTGLQQKYQSDMSVGGFQYLYDGAEPKPGPAEEKEEVLDACEAIIRMNYNRGFGATAWAKLYKRELILAHPFPEGQIYEDLAILYQIVGDCGSVAVGNRRIYYWVQRTGSTMRMEFDERQMAAMDAASAQIEYVKERYPAALPSAEYRHTAKAVELIAVCFGSGGDRDVFRRLKAHMDRYSADVLKDSHTKKSMRLRILAAGSGYLPAKIAFAAHEKAKKGKLS